MGADILDLMNCNMASTTSAEDLKNMPRFIEYHHRAVVGSLQ
jgi:hypothetical protein